MSSVIKLDYTSEDLPMLSKEVKLKGSFTSNLTVEPLAEHHWVFDKGNSQSFTDLVLGTHATPQTSIKREFFNSVALDSQKGNALDLNIEQTSQFVTFMVFQKNSFEGQRFLCGNAEFTGQSNTGFFMSSPTENNVDIKVRKLDDTTSVIASGRLSLAVIGEWVFVAGGVYSSGSEHSASVFVGPDSWTQVSPINEPAITSRNIGLGNMFYDSFPGTGETKFAEFGIVRGKKLTKKLGEELFQRSKERMLKRGIKLFSKTL